MCFLDLSNAFGSIPHQVIHLMLERLGLGGQFGDIVRDMYTNATMSVKTSNTETGSIAIGSGVKQGDPLSPTLFCIALEYLIRNIKHKLPDLGYEPEPGHRTRLLAYADDLAIVCKSRKEMQLALNELSALAQLCCLKFKPSKCATLCLRQGKAVEEAVFEIQGDRMPALKASEFYNYLGAPIGVDLASSGLHLELFSKASADLIKIGDSALAPWQKVDAVKTFIISRFYYRFANSALMIRNMIDFDLLVRKVAKKVLNLPKSAANEYLQMPMSMGGIGLLPLQAIESVTVISHMFRLLTSRRELTRRLAIAALRDEVRYKLRRDPSDADVNAHLEVNADARKRVDSNETPFARLRNAIAYLSISAPVKLKLSGNDVTLTLRDSVNGELSFNRGNRHLVQRSIGRQLGRHLQQEMLKHPIQGAASKLCLKDRASFQFLRDARYISFGAYKFIHKARLQLLPLNAYTHDENRSKACRRCDYHHESVQHVLGGCKMHLGAITERHNAVQDLLVDTIKKCAKVPLQIAVNKVCSVVPGELRPDIIIRNTTEKKIFVIDITCPTETRPESFENARVTKIQKYKAIHDHYQAQGFTVILDAFIIGSLGAYDPLNDDLLRELGIPYRMSRVMIRKMIGSCIEYSKNIFWHHIIGDNFRQRSVRAGGPVDAPKIP